MKILKDITISSYLNLINSDNKVFVKFYSSGFNLSDKKYRSLLTDDELDFDVFDVDESASPDLVPTADTDGDIENSIKIFEWLENLTLSDANDPRFWTSLTHIKYQDYTRARWKIKTSTTLETIRERFFYSGGGLRARLRNAISRLWWVTKLTVREDLDDKYFYTRVLWSSQDLMQNLMERSLGTYPEVRFAVLEFYSKRTYSDKEFRIFFKELNTLGAISPLSLLTKNDVLNFLSKIEEVYYPNSGTISNMGEPKGKYLKAVKENIIHSEKSKGGNFKFYLKLATLQDVTRTFVLNKQAVDSFFDLSLFDRNDECYISVKYSFDKKSYTVRIEKKQDYRIFIFRTNLKVGDLVLFEKKSKNEYFITFISKKDEIFNLYKKNLHNSSYALLDSID